MSKLPIFELSGHSEGPGMSKFASASVQAVWPSAASGLIEIPSGSDRDAERSDEGELANPRNWAALSCISRPEAESVRSLVSAALKTGSNVSAKHPVVGAYWDSAWAGLP